MAKTVREDSGEQGRRDLVADIARRGSAAYAARDTATAGVQSLQAGAEEQIGLAPVDLNQAQADALAAISGEAVDNTEQFAEAQRSIYAGGQARELAYGNEYYDDTAVIGQSINSALGRYEVALQEQEAERLEAERLAAARRQSNSLNLDAYLDAYGDGAPDTGASELYPDTPTGYNGRATTTNLSPDQVNLYSGSFQWASEQLGLYLNEGASMQDAISGIWNSLSSSGQWSTGEISDIVDAMAAEAYALWGRSAPRNAPTAGPGSTSLRTD